MTAGTLRAGIRYALAEAGATGLTMVELIPRVSAFRGRPTSRSTIAGMISDMMLTHRSGPSIAIRRNGDQLLRYAIDAEPPPEPPAAAEPLRLTGTPKTLTAALLGDPLPGRSALAQRDRERMGVHA